MNESNMNQTPNTENGYPQSQQPFPTSDMPYPISGYAEEKKSKTMQIAIISIVAVLIIALATTLIVVLQRRNQQQMGGGMQPPPMPMETMITVSKSGSMINGQPATVNFIEEDGKSYLKLEDISSTAGYDFVREGNKIKLLSQLELAIIEVGSTKVTLQDQTSKETSSVEILKAPFDRNGDVYIYSRDLSVFLKNTNVSYNSMNDSIEIRISAGMGGPGGQPPQGGQMPQGGQPQQNTDAVQTEKADAAKQAEAQGGQPPQNGQMPQGAQPPQN